MKTSILIIPFIFLIGLGNFVQAQEKKVEITSENITYLKEDGRSYINYYTTRSGFDSYWIAVDKKANFEQRYQYIFPQKYTVDTLEDRWYNRLLFDQGSYAVIVHDSFATSVTQSDDGVFTYTNQQASNGQGIKNTSGNFNLYVYVWVLPDNFEFVDYSCTVGDSTNWVERGNTVTFFGYDVNNLIFKIRYQSKHQENTKKTLKALSTLDQSTIAFKSVNEGINITILGDLLFDSGSDSISQKGVQMLDSLATIIQRQDFEELIISGHTDSIPITESKSKFSSNWDLSAARASAVMEIFSHQNIPGKKLKVQAFGAHRPVESNETKEGRSKNRRIEILLAKSVDY